MVVDFANGWVLDYNQMAKIPCSIVGQRIWMLIKHCDIRGRVSGRMHYKGNDNRFGVTCVISIH